MRALWQSVRALAASEMASDPAHDLAHLDRVWESARTIAETEPSCDMAALMAAAYLHDIVNLPKDAPNRDRASRLAADRAGALLPALGLGPETIRAACHAIAAHSFSAGIPPETAEARILRDADRLDAIGSIGIARWFATSGLLGRPLYDTDDPFAVSRTPDDRHFALDHWRLKLQQIEQDMLTETGRAMARERSTRMARFLADLAHEIGTPLPRSWKA